MTQPGQHSVLKRHTLCATPLQVNLIMPSMVCGLIIGKQGQTIKTLQDLSAADIK